MNNELKEQTHRTFKGFVSGTLINFIENNKLEKIQVEDVNGNKAKIVRDKDNNLKVETTIKETY